MKTVLLIRSVYFELIYILYISGILTSTDPLFQIIIEHAHYLVKGILNHATNDSVSHIIIYLISYS